MNLIPEVKAKVERPFGEKFMETQHLIAVNIHRFKNPTVAWSGGKDSTLVLWLCLKLKPDILTVFNNTGVEYPETVEFISKIKTEWNLNFITLHPETSFFKIVEKFGYSNSKVEKGHGHGSPCCLNLKEKPMLKFIKSHSIDCVFTGITAVESRQRQMVALRIGSCYHAKSKNTQMVHPIQWWTEEEVWQYHEDMNIESNPIYHVGGYRKGSARCGCMPCTSYKDWENVMQRLTPKLYKVIKLKKDKQYVMDVI